MTKKPTYAELRETLAEVRRRTVTPFWKGTADDDPRWWSCRLCSRIWKDGDEELHEASCPMQGSKPSKARSSAWN